MIIVNLSNNLKPKRMFPFTSKDLESVRAEPYKKVMKFTFCACIFTHILKV